MLILAPISSIIALLFASFLVYRIMKESPGDEAVAVGNGGEDRKLVGHGWGRHAGGVSWR